ncbi:MAG: hypothetical protein KJ771_08555 [Nanoarchaeota archaeon]|nr:hypothetical protein [Nanoarchaeota archaeon]
MNPIPNPITVNTGEQERVSKTIDLFFVETKEFIEENYEVDEPYFQIKSGELAYNSTQITDDRITYLSYKDMILASVFETRTEFNYIRYIFFRNLEGFGELAPKK